MQLRPQINAHDRGMLVIMIRVGPPMACHVMDGAAENGPKFVFHAAAPCHEECCNSGVDANCAQRKRLRQPRIIFIHSRAILAGYERQAGSPSNAARKQVRKGREARPRRVYRERETADQTKDHHPLKQPQPSILYDILSNISYKLTTVRLEVE